MTDSDPMRGARPGDQDHLWTEQEIESRTGGHGRREIRRGARRAARRRKRNR